MEELGGMGYSDWKGMGVETESLRRVVKNLLLAKYTEPGNLSAIIVERAREHFGREYSREYKKLYDGETLEE